VVRLAGFGINRAPKNVSLGAFGGAISRWTGLGVRKIKGRAVFGVKPKDPYVGYRRRQDFGFPQYGSSDP